MKNILNTILLIGLGLWLAACSSPINKESYHIDDLFLYNNQEAKKLKSQKKFSEEEAQILTPILLELHNSTKKVTKAAPITAILPFFEFPMHYRSVTGDAVATKAHSSYRYYPSLQTIYTTHSNELGKSINVENNDAVLKTFELDEFTFPKGLSQSDIQALDNTNSNDLRLYLLYTSKDSIGHDIDILRLNKAHRIADRSIVETTHKWTEGTIRGGVNHHIDLLNEALQLENLCYLHQDLPEHPLQINTWRRLVYKILEGQASIESMHFLDQAAQETNAELFITSPLLKTKENIGIGSTLEEFIKTYPQYTIWHTYVSDRFVLEAKSIDAVSSIQFLLSPKDFKGKLPKNPSDMTILKIIDFEPTATIESIRIF
ncbi:MAG: hypothetical protein GY810_13255 [Aureispira sp.]|nr:hypothetical protein [Aureispira sp.]